MRDVEALLRDLAAEVAFPPTPDFGPTVRRRLQQPAPPARQPGNARRLALALALIAIVALAALAFPPTRDSIAKFIGLRGVSIEQRPSPLPSTALAGIDRVLLGPPTSLDEARLQAGIPVRVPADLGVPDEVRVSGAQPRAVVSLVYNPGAGRPDPNGTGVGVLITQLHARVDRELFRKVAGGRTTVEEVEVDGVTGYWIAGRPHEVVIRDVDGDVRPDTLRLAEDTLVWQVGDVTYRIESALRRDEVIRIANSFR